MQDNAGWKKFSVFLKKDWFLDLMITISRMPLHTTMLCKSQSLRKLDQKWLGIHFLFLYKTDTLFNSAFKIPVVNNCRLITPQTHPGHGRYVASWTFNYA